MKKTLNFSRPQLVNFSVIYPDGRQELKYQRWCRRPFATKEYKKLLSGLSSGKFKTVVTGPGY